MVPVLCRGDDFRVEFLHLGEVQSLILSKVNIMALTATATRTLLSDVCYILGMKDPHIVMVSPDKSNVILRVSPFESYENAFNPVIDEIKVKRLSMGRTIIYCQKQETCATFLAVSDVTGENLQNQLVILTCHNFVL